MARKTYAEKIAELENKLRMYEEIVERVEKRNKELVDAEENTFLHSPTYLQMREQIGWLENLNKLYEYNVASAKKSAKKVDALVQQVFEDNKRIIQEQADTEYFVGITENWHEAWEYKKLQERILELEAQVEQEKQAISVRDSEIERLQKELSERICSKMETKSDLDNEELLRRYTVLSMQLQEEFLKRPQDFDKQKILNEEFIALKVELRKRLKNEEVQMEGESKDAPDNKANVAENESVGCNEFPHRRRGR